MKMTHVMSEYYVRCNHCYSQVVLNGCHVAMPSCSAFVNPCGLGPTKLSLIRNEDDAIYCHSSCGPVFSTVGLRHDLCISDNANTSPSNSYVGTAYELHKDNREPSLQAPNISLSQITRCLDSASDNYQAGEINSYS